MVQSQMKSSSLVKGLLFLSVLSVASLPCLDPCLARTPQPAAKEKLEVAKLQQEIETGKLAPIFQQLTISIALITAAVSIISAFFSLRQQRKSNDNQLALGRASQISELLKRFGDPDQSVRSSAVFGLAQYEGTRRHILGISLAEKNADVLDAIAEVLASEPKASLALAGTSFRALASRRIRIASELQAQGILTDDVSHIVGTAKRKLSKAFNSREGAKSAKLAQARRDQSERIALLSPGEKGPPPLSDLLMKAQSLDQAHRNLVYVTEKILAQASRDKIEVTLKNFPIGAIDLSGMSIAGWVFEDSDLSGAYFDDVSAQFTRFIRCDLDLASFREAGLHDSEFSESSLQEATFQKARLKRARFLKSKSAYKANFSGAKLEKAEFELTPLVQAGFIGSLCTTTKFADCDLNGADLSRAIFNDASFDGVSLRGTTLTLTALRRSKFRAVTMAGNTLIKTDFSNATFSDVSMDKIKHVQDVVLTGVDRRTIKITDSPLLEIAFVDNH